MDWLDSEEYKWECAANVEEWGKTLWSIWKAQSRAGVTANGDLFNKVPDDVARLDCWKVADLDPPASPEM